MSAHTRQCVLGLFILAAFLSACGPVATSPPAMTPLTIQLRWTHQAQFAGFYAADQKGYYAAEGLSVTLVPGGQNVDLVTPVVSNTAQFGDAGADVLILARAEGKPVRAIATIYRRSPTVFIALADSGIARPQDFVGKAIRVTPDNAPTFHAMMSRAGIHPAQYTEVSFPNDLALFASGKAPVWTSFIDGFALTAQRAGHKINIIYPDDYGIHFCADSIFATDELITTHPDLVRRFLRASLKGWTYAVENPAEIGPMVTKYKPDADPVLETAKMTASIPLINTGEDHIGWMKPDVWAGMEQTLREQGVLTRTLEVTQTYTLQFLEEIYGSGK